MSKPNTIQHFTHNHPLTEANVVGTYTCNGCKLYGDGKTYRCKDCDYDLHEYCATCPATLRYSWHAPDHELSLITGPTHMAERGCYVCRVYIQGMFYKCKHCSFESHPHCAHGPMHAASSPRATTIVKQRSLHDHAGQGQPSSPHHYGQGIPFGYGHMDPYGPFPHVGGHQPQHPYMNPSSPKANPSPDSSKGKKKPGGFLGPLKAALAVTATVAGQVAFATMTDGYTDTTAYDTTAYEYSGM
ncbi:hypothetical protein EUTSA_v10017974mg [Eutrema salsugineum]|uniref:DC1 domain-containing protein n=1 Tax=Eutrema salsugineum TaxID=72664 RepID=V4MIM1_EUTSA|nr:uncharacterized protein LOC18026922 [Eutrema salsugineum]ESQ52423.1 hypothetical protein EUTSA_v10017974mg [Eutrema salsugineum]